MKINRIESLVFGVEDGDASTRSYDVEVNGFDEVYQGGKTMMEQGWKASTRLGRHMLGSNISWYFTNPSGGNTEYFADMDLMDDNWPPRIWEKHPGWASWELDQ